VKEKTQSDQRRDEVLQRMLKTPPQPNIAKKPVQSAPKNVAANGTAPNPLKQKRESPSEK
jgi:hypothetical protein